MAEEQELENPERFAFVVQDNSLSEAELEQLRPEGYEPGRPRSVPYRYEEWDRLSALLPASQELVARIDQLRQAKPGSQLADDDLALSRDMPDGVGIMTAFVEQRLMDISTHCEAIGLLAAHPYTQMTRSQSAGEYVYGSSSAIAVHQRAIIETAAALVWVLGPAVARERYQRLVKELRDELLQWDHRQMAEEYNTVIPMADTVGRIIARYALDFDKSGERRRAHRDAEAPKKRRTGMIESALGPDVYWAWKRTTMDAHGSVLLSQMLLAEGTPFLQPADARFRANAVNEALRASFDEVKKSLEAAREQGDAERAS